MKSYGRRSEEANISRDDTAKVPDINFVDVPGNAAATARSPRGEHFGLRRANAAANLHQSLAQLNEAGDRDLGAKGQVIVAVTENAATCAAGGCQMITAKR